MKSIAEQLKAKALKEYETNLANIPLIARYHSLQKKILDLWVESGMLRKGTLDKSAQFPFYLKLKLGPTDRLDVEVPYFSEKIEELFDLPFLEPYLEGDAVRQNYAPPGRIAYLSIFFIPFSDGKCRIVLEEIGEETVKKYRAKVVCG